MQVQPIKIYNPKLFFVNNINAVILNSNTTPYKNDSVELSFKGFFENSTTPINLEQAKEYSSVHCPNCGTKMLSISDYEKIISKSAQAKTAGELTEIIYDNEQYIPQKFYRIINDIKQIPDYKTMTIPEFRSVLSKIAMSDKNNAVKETKDFLNNYAQNFSQEKKDKALTSVSEITTTEHYDTQREKIGNFFQSLELDTEQEKDIKAKFFQKLLLTDSYSRIFNSSKLAQMSEDEYGAFMIERLFYPSLSKVVKISRYPNHEGLPNNNVLLCRSCLTNQSKNVFWKFKNPKEMKYNIKTYLMDIAYLMGNNRIDNSKDYIKAFVGISGKLSKHTLIFTPDELHSIMNLRKLATRHDGFAPIEQTEVDIPCAECGSTMLPHQKRVQIEKELKNCNTPYEYAQILKKYKKYIGVHFKVLADIFIDITDKYPDISVDEFIRKFQKTEHQYTQKAIKNILTNYMNERSFIARTCSPEQLAIYETFGYRVKKYIDDGKFDNFEISELVNECTKDIDLVNYPVSSIYHFFKGLRNIEYKHRCSGIKKYNFDDKDTVYTILFNLFKFNVATVDHLIPESKGGERDKYNLIGLCKHCNRLKSHKEVRNWIAENKKAVENIRKQLLVIDNMAKSGKLEGYDDWAKNIALKIYESTSGKYDLREDFI